MDCGIFNPSHFRPDDPENDSTSARGQCAISIGVQGGGGTDILCKKKVGAWSTSLVTMGWHAQIALEGTDTWDESGDSAEPLENLQMMRFG